MKNLGYAFIALFLIVGCATQSKTAGLEKPDTLSDTLRIANDSLEYEIIIIEPGFNQWLVTQRPRNFYEQFWLENRNQISVINYNNRVLDPAYSNELYQLQIDYRRDIDYGYEVNYLLYHWFKFFEERNNTKLR